MGITAKDVQKLREMTGVGMMDCKKALTEAEGDMDKAIEILREKGLAASAKKAGRIAAEGMAYAAVIDGVGVVVEVNAETDFVGKNEKFVNFVKGVAATVAACNPADLDALMACKYDGTDLTVQEQQQEMVLVIGENIKVRRFARFAEGFCVPYIHAGGKIGVLVSLNVEGDIDATEIGKDVAMQIAALNPRFWDKSQVTEDVLEARPGQGEDRGRQAQQVLLRELPAPAGVRQGRRPDRGEVYRFRCQGSGRHRHLP